jgi:O-antigen/teichoic acid export membrane protein
LGIREYGVYVFLSTVISMLGLLDFGISTAVSKYLAEYYVQNNHEKIKNLLGTANTIFSIVAIIGLSVFIIGSFIPSFTHLLSGYTNYFIGIVAAGLLFTITSISSVYSITFSALQRFDIGSKVGIVLIALQQLSILTLVLYGYSINAIFVTQLVIALISFFIQKKLAQRILPEIPRMLSWNKIEAIKCYKFGLVTFINNISTSSLTYLDRLILPFFLGPSNLTYYSLPGNITTRIPGISNSLSGILFPMASSLQGLGDIEKIRVLYVRSFRLITVIAAAITVTILAYAHQILQYWISPDFADKSTTVLIILAFTNFVLALGGPLSSLLLGLGKLKFLTTLSIIMAVTNTILLVILLPLSGINGAAWAYLLSLFPIAYMFYFTERHYLSLSERKKYYRKIILGNIFVGLIIYEIAEIFLIHLITNLLMVLIMSALTGLLYLGLYWLFGLFEKEDVDSIKLFLGRLLRVV